MIQHSTKPLKLGFIGGSIDSAVGFTHKIASEMDNLWTIEAGCFSRNQDTNQKTAERWNIAPEHIYSDFSTLLREEKTTLDAIAILTPTPLHADMVVTVLEQGYPVICEKSMACSVDEALRVKQTVTKHNGFLAVTLNYSGYPMIRELKNLVREGVLGHIRQIHIEMPQQGFISVNSHGQTPQPQNWRLHDEVIPTISLDLGIHLHHLIHFLTEEQPVEVCADYSTLGSFQNIVDNVMCMARYTNNIRCSMWYSKSAIGHRNGLRVRLYGDKASAEWYQMQPEDLLLNFPDGRQRIFDRADNESQIATQRRYNRFKPGHPAGFIEAFANLYSDIADSLETFKTSGSFSSTMVRGVEHSIKGLQLFEAISESAKHNAWIKI